MVSTILFWLRIWSWIIGVLLCLIASPVGNENGFLVELTMKYFIVTTSLASLIPIATISLIIDSARYPSRAGKDLKKVIILAVGFMLYISLDIAFFHGGV